MKRCISPQTILHLRSKNQQQDFVIDGIAGVGGSCIAYKVSYVENGNIPHKGILKEYCPAFLKNDMFTRTGTALNVPEEFYAAFSKGLDEFKDTYRYINQYLSDNPSATNYHPVQLGLYEGNNTAYTLTSCDYGMSYDKIDDDSLLSICKIMLSVTKAVELYHNAGFLHLDIKPKNILILDEVTDLVKLFDYDSLTSIEKIKSRDVSGIPAPEDYYVPDLEERNLRNIDIATDIFEIGAMLFSRVFKRAPEISDMSYDSQYDIDGNPLFIGISPQAKNEFVELLRKTVQIAKIKRYKTTQELKNKLEKIISLISEEKPYLINLPKWQPSKYCIGRKAELKEIKRRLDSDGYVFVKGIGGLGKSEIAKLFAKQYGDEYHTVQFCKFSDSLKSVVATMPINGIDEKNYGNADELVKEKNKVLHMSDGKTLIIIDNFNVTYDDFLREFLPVDNKSFKVIFTTRCAMAADYYDSKTYELPKLSADECKKLFFSHCSDISIDENEADVESLIEFVDYNTLIIVLMAIAARKSGISPHDVLLKLEEQKMDSIEAEFFHEYDFSSDEVNAYNKIYSHLTTIFSICNLKEIQKEILKNATLISLNGIGLSEFTEHCESPEINRFNVEELVDMGWLNKDSDDVVSMHPIISDLFSANEDLCRKDSYYKFAEYLEDFCNPDFCHFSIVLNKLACAKHLERRYINEPDNKKVIISIKLGRMYKNVYQHGNARKYLKKALALAEASGMNAEIIYIYCFLGGVEKEFGTQSKAVEYYRKSIYEGKKLKNRFYYAVIESMIAIAECYKDNNDNIKAYNSYLEALNYAKIFNLKEYIADIAVSLLEICRELDWTDKENLYIKVFNKYKVFAEPEEEMPGVIEFNQTVIDKDFEESLTAYEKMLAVQREKLGEESPMYKDLKKGLWVYYAINGQKEQAIYLLNESLMFIESTFGRDSMEMAEQLATASNMMVELQEFENAERFSKRAIEICELNNAVYEYVYVEAILSLTAVYIVKWKLNEAMALVGKIDFSQFSGNEVLSDIVCSAGMVMCQLSKFDEIEPLCSELLRSKNADDYGRCFANIILAIINEQRGKLDEALRYAAEAKELAATIKTEHIKKEWFVSYYRSVARIQSRKGQHEAAIQTVSDIINSFSEKEQTSYVLNGAYTERGLFYLYAGDMSRAMEDFKKCEKILTDSNLPDEAFCSLFNNIAIYYEKAGQPEKAKEYLEKIVKVNGKVLNPESYFEAVVCNNVARINYILGDAESAVGLMKKAIAAYLSLGVDNTMDFLVSKSNLAYFYISLENFHEAHKLYSDIRENYDVAVDINGDIAVKSNGGIIVSLLRLDRASEAYDFACEELRRFEEWFGKTSSVRVKVILQMGGWFREYGYSDCYDFFILAEDLICESGDFKSVNYARTLNYLGACLTDYEKKHVRAKSYFERSKALFEEINATDDEAYPVAVENIKYVQDLIMDDLLSEAVQSIIDETTED